ncbi:MAG: GAF domain-containing sensor histidine kinase [Cyanobacteria bacterium SZAS TMP-1]|nr:GAF domain-containing sensor histidine kinase [Cyanobacteria bacterium SZAS TMP-1]
MTATLNRVREGKARTRESAAELYLKSEQLLRFRIAFALVSLALCVGISTFAGDEFEFYSSAAIIGGVSIYSFVGLAFVVRKLRLSPSRLRLFNGVMITLDVLALTGLIHYTKGIESDLYVLYLLPVLLSSYTFGKRGIYFAAVLVSVAYIGLLTKENEPFLPYIFSEKGSSGLAAAYASRLWRRILGRAFFFSSVAMLWARFCDYMSQVARQGQERLYEQLDANERLVHETDERAKRERMINFINKAVRSTLELDKVFLAAVVQLSQAVECDLVTIAVANPDGGKDAPVMVERARQTEEEKAQGKPSSLPGMDPRICQYILDNKGSYERDPKSGAKIKTFVFREPADDAFFTPVAELLREGGYHRLMIQPMMYGEFSKGVLILADRTTRDFAQAEVVLTKVVAGQVAVAIEHAGLVRELSHKNEDLVEKNLNLDSKNSELKTVQSQLVHQEKMASLGRLVAGIAHELNNPINFVHGNLPYLKQYVDELKRVVSEIDKLPEADRRPVDELKNKLKYDFLVTDLDNIIADLNEGSERIRHIIKNLKSFSRLDEAELKEASIVEGIESTLKILSQFYGRDKIPVDSNLSDLQLPQVLCYPGQLNQVWMNLLSNAAQAMADVPEPLLKIRGELEAESVLVEIHDCGGGIKAEIQSKIFDPFFTTKPVGQGTGLGLSICHSIIERHGGQIWLTSEPRKGTSFFVRVPLVAKRSSGQNGQELLVGEPD